MYNYSMNDATYEFLYAISDIVCNFPDATSIHDIVSAWNPDVPAPPLCALTCLDADQFCKTLDFWAVPFDRVPDEFLKVWFKTAQKPPSRSYGVDLDPFRFMMGESIRMYMQACFDNNNVRCAKYMDSIGVLTLKVIDTFNRSKLTDNAINYKNMDIITWGLERGFKLNGSLVIRNLSFDTYSDATIFNQVTHKCDLLMDAAMSGSIQWFDWVVSNYENINVTESTFTCAAAYGHINLMQHMYDKLYPFDYYTYIAAVHHGNRDNVQWLLDNGASRLPW